MICYNLDRFSEDLDFNLTKEVNLDNLLNNIKEKFNKLDYNTKFNRTTKSSTSYIFFIEEPLYMGKPESLCRIELDFSNRDDIYLDYIPKKIHHIFDEFTQFHINCLSLDEIFAEKIRCILTREKSRDIYDLHYLINRKVKFDLKLINKKLKIYELKFEKEKFYLALDKKEKLWNLEMKFLVKNVDNFKEVINEIKIFIENKIS